MTMMTSADVRRTCGGVSLMTLHRWIKGSGFPRPVYVNNRRFWRADDVNAWWNSRSTIAPPSPRTAATADT